MRSLEAGICPLDLTTIALQEWLPHIIESFQERANAQQQKLRVSVSPEIPPIVSDRASLTRIMTELLNNACKYTPINEAIEVTACLVLRSPDPVLQIVVRNSGVEIPSDQLSQIFEPFYRIPNNDPWRYGGTGLGLALIKKLIAHLQGAIDSNSTQGWTTFTVQLPLSIAK
jgi:signal transduction histidine kinase